MVAEKIEFDLAGEISLIPTYCRAQESQQKNSIIDDQKAEEIIAQIDFDYDKLKTPKQAYLTLCLRAKKIDDYVQKFINENSDATIVQLACGLSTRANRSNNYNRWYDVDNSKIIDFRKNFYQSDNHYQMISSSTLDYSWIDNLAEDNNYLFIAEGLFMYLKEEDIKELVLKLQNKFSGSQLVFDCYNQKTVDKINKYHQKSGSGIKLEWGLNDAKKLEQWANGIQLIEQWHYTDSKELKKLFIVYRLLFKLAKLFKSLKQSHRILYYRL